MAPPETAASSSASTAAAQRELLRRYGPGAGLEDRVAYLTERLLNADAAREWKTALKEELRKPEHPLELLQCNARGVATSSSNDSSGSCRTSKGHGTIPPDVAPLYRILDRMGLVGAIKRRVIDLHGEAQREVQAAVAEQLRDEAARFVPAAAAATVPGRGGGGSNSSSNSSSGASTLDVIQRAREDWERVTREELLRFARDHGRPLVAQGLNPIRSVRKAAASASAVAVDESGGGDAPEPMLPSDPEPVRTYKPPPTTRFLYDGLDLLHTLQAIKPMNRTPEAMASALGAWGSIQLQLYAPSSAELRRTYKELGPTCGQIGLDELFPQERGAFLAEKNRVGDLVLTHRSVAMARQYAKTGCPASLRPGIWRQALGQPTTPPSAEARRYFARLQELVTAWTYVTDDMYLLDLQRAINSTDYFVFQDHLDSVLMAFTRDADVQERALQVNGAVELQQPHVPAPPPSAAVPPNGVLPFSGLVMYAAPLTYLYTDEVELYFVFRELYVRYWCRLNAVRGEPSTILGLCKLFEELIVRSSPGAVYHLLNVGLRPLDVAFPWIQCAFSGVLEIQQVLLLWDRILGYDALELVAVLAAALFHFRAAELETVTTMDDVRELYAELLEIQVVPLLQEYLFLLI